jgi:peptidoglycan biosynthesis protein MviN/MurJ (putative lipid II flippase)
VVMPTTKVSNGPLVQEYHNSGQRLSVLYFPLFFHPLFTSLLIMLAYSLLEQVVEAAPPSTFLAVAVLGGLLLSWRLKFYCCPGLVAE